MARMVLSLMASMPLPGRHNRGAAVEQEQRADEQGGGGGGGGGDGDGGNDEGAVDGQEGASQRDDSDTHASPAEPGAD